jgi:acetyltransferase
MRDDRTFGPFLLLGDPVTGALLPLNAALAHDVLAPLAAANRWAGRDTGSFADALVSLSFLLSSVSRVCAFTARVRSPRIGADGGAAVPHPTLDHVSIGIRASGARRALAIRSYPVDLEEHLDWDGHRLTIRPIRPEDEAAHAEFFSAMTPNDLRLRFFGFMRTPGHAQLARYVQIDYDREMAFVACTTDAGRTVIHGVVRAVTDPDNDSAEFAVTIRSDEKGHHLGRTLMDRIIRYCKVRGTRLLVGDVLRENARMLSLARDCGFTVKASEDPTVMSVQLPLNP